MSQAFGQNPSPDSSRSADGVPAPFAAAARVLPPGNADQDIFRTSLRRSLRLHRRLALAFATSGLVLALAYLVAFWSTYSAQCIIYIQPTPSAVLESVAPMHWPYNYDPATFDSYIQQQLLTVTRRDVLAGAVHNLGPGVWQRRGESEQSAAARLKDAIEVARLGASYQISITAHASNAETSAALANAVAASYIETISHDQKAGAAAQLAMLGDERDRVKKELDDDLAEQAALNNSPGAAARGSLASGHYDDEIARTHQDLVKARAEHDEAAARLTAITAKNGHSSSSLDAEATARIQDQLRVDLERTAATENQLNSRLAEMTRAAASATPKLQRSSDLAGDITRLQNLYTAVDEQFQNQSLDDSAPGLARLAAAATAPSHPDESTVISNAVVLLLVFVFLGLVAAIAAHKIDPRVCVASDVENLLGVAPMAQLPDFDEVSEEVADFHLLRLAGALDYACKDGSMRSCVFTGTGHRAGVTKIATRVREKLESMGRAAVLVDATGSTQETFRPIDGDERSETEPASQGTMPPIALLQQVTQHDETRRGVLVLTDTAPLAVSAETECLVRFADCVVVVIESGVTTRAQLRRVTALLQRLNLSAVAFVLNRVSLAKADTAFRNSVQEIEKHLRTQGRPADWRAIRSRYFTSDLVGAGAEASIPADSAAVNQQGSADETGRSAEAEGAELSEFAAPLPDVQREIHQPTWQPDDIPWWLSDALARFEAAHSTPVAQPLHAPDKEIPIPAEAESQEESISAELLPIVEEETPHEIEAHSNGTAGMLFTVVRDELNQSAHPTSHAGNAAAAPEEPANGNKSRLSSLRGIVSPKNLKELEQARHSTDYVSQAAPVVDRAAPQTVQTRSAALRFIAVEPA